MAGIAGALIGLASGAQPVVAPAKAVADGTTSARGCTTNFIGYGFGLTSAEPLPQDFIAADDTVTRSTTAPTPGIPTYTAIAGNTTHQTLSWAVVLEDPEVLEEEVVEDEPV
jgi:hypothetical protein